MPRTWIGNASARALTEACARQPRGPVLLEGPSGVGKRTFLVETLRDFLGDEMVLEPEASAEAIRDACSECSHVPADGYLALVVSDLQALSDAAQDSLLKILEEPPSGSVVFLVADHGGRISAPIVSRIRTTVRWSTVPEPDLVNMCGDEFHARISFGSPSLCLASVKTRGVKDLFESACRDDWPVSALSSSVPDILDEAKGGTDERTLVVNALRLASRVSRHGDRLLSLASVLSSTPSVSASLHWLTAASSAL